MFAIESVFCSVMHFLSQRSDEAASFHICLLPSKFTIDHPSDRSIRRKEFSKLTPIKTFVFEIMNPAKARSWTIMSIESKISRALNLDKVLKGTANAKVRKTHFS